MIQKKAIEKALRENPSRISDKEIGIAFRVVKQVAEDTKERQDDLRNEIFNRLDELHAGSVALPRRPLFDGFRLAALDAIGNGAGI